MEIKYIESEAEFEAIKKDNELLVVDFFSEDCPPCEKLAPIYEKMAGFFPSIKFVKIFRQGLRPLAESLSVSGSPTVLFFKAGAIQEARLSGEIQEDNFVSILESLSGLSAGKNAAEDDVRKTDLCIIGNGPAGITAAIYAARYKVDQIMVGDLAGGLMTSSHKICNFPSQTEISGMELSQMMADQVNALEVPQINARITKITRKGDFYELESSNNDRILAKTVLLTAGTKHRHLGLPNEESLVGRGVSYCATCDGAFFNNKTVAVIGGSDTANTASLYLAQVASKVYQIYRKGALRGETAWIDQIKENDKIQVIYNTEVVGLVGENQLNSVVLSTPFEGTTELKVDGAFVEIGSEPDLHLIKQLGLTTDDGNYVVIAKDQTTNQLGVWAAGDITNGSNNFRQIITACSEGAIAAQNIFEYLQRKK